MKKYYLLLGFIVGLFACTQENNLYDELSDGRQKTVLKQAGDGVHDLLGFSYDITKEYLHVDAAPRVVLDIAAFKRDNPNRYYYPTSTIGNTEFYSGATAVDMLEEIKTKSKSSASLTGIPLPFGAAFGGSIKTETETDTKYTFSSKYSYARADVIKRVKRLYLDADLQMLLKYVHSTFYENLNRLSPDQFVAEYGTHVLTDITIGGRLTFTYRSCITEESNYSRKKEIVEAGVKFSIGKFGADANKSHENETIKSLNTKNTSSKVWVNYHGGEQSGLSFEYDGSVGPPKTNFSLTTWEGSVKDSNAALTDINWAKAYPIYDFITDPTKKAQIKAAVEKYIASKKVEEILELLPLFRIYDLKTGDVFCTSFYDEAKILVGTGNYVWDDGISHMNKTPIQGYLLKKQIAGTIPLYRLYNRKNDVFCTTFYDEARIHVNSGSYVWDDGINHVNKTPIQGYVYKTQVPGTIPLYRLYNRKNDVFCTTFYDEARIHVNSGSYVWDDGINHMNKTSIQGYIYPY